MRKYLLLGPLVFVILWFLITYFNIVQTFFIPSPIKVFEALYYEIIKGDIIVDVFGTIYRWLISIFIGIILGVPFGMLMGLLTRFNSFFEIIIDFFRSLPAIALFPIFMVLFGLGNLSKIISAGMASFLYITISTTYGVKYARNSHLLIAKIYHANNWQTLKSILLPGALPQIFVGIRVSVSLTLIVIIAAEMITGSERGLGKIVHESALLYDSPKMYMGILIIGILGYAANKGFLWIESKIIHWRGE